MVVYHCHVEMLEVGDKKNSRCAPLAPGFTKWALDRKLHTGLARVVHILENRKMNTSELNDFWRENSKCFLSNDVFLA